MLEETKIEQDSQNIWGVDFFEKESISEPDRANFMKSKRFRSMDVHQEQVSDIRQKFNGITSQMLIKQPNNFQTIESSQNKSLYEKNL